MNTTEILQHFEESAAIYIRDLETYDMEQLTRKPAEDQWSLGQMYMHLIGSALYMQLRNVEACLESNDNPEITAVMSEAGKAVYVQGSFPPIAIHVPPSKEYTPQQPESKEQISNGLKLVIGKMRELEPLLAASPLKSTCNHPRFGALNAREWYRLVEMHYRHHFMQKNRLEKLL